MTGDLFSYAGDGLFSGPAPRLRAAPASVAFLDLLAEKMVEALARPDDPFALSDALVFLPNQRARQGLIDAFARRLGGAALLPTIRAVGDPHVDDDPDIWGADPLEGDIAPAIEPARRLLELASLIRAREKVEGGVEDPARAIALAVELRKLLDSAAAADAVHWDKLPHLADEADLARHWEGSAKFLEIVSTYWPQRLAADALSDPSARRSALLLALAKLWENAPPDRPVVIAGSTGSQGATRALMRAVSHLPRGVVVLPGLDIDLDEGSWRAVREQHPQFALKETLEALGVSRSDITLLGSETPRGRARRVLMREALAPAEKTADWLARVAAAGGKPFIERGAEGVSLLEATTEDEEATAIALLLREAYETPERSAALVTPDVGLARRVEAKLARWGLAPVVSHGRPLRETPPGALIALLCELAGDPGEPVALAALLKHPLSALADEQARTALEHEVLRGPRRFITLTDLEERAESRAAKALAVRLLEALAPLIAFAARAEATLADFADALAETAENMAPAHLMWRGIDGQGAADLLREARNHGGELGGMSAHFAPRALMKLMESREIPPQPGGDPRLAIWGPLEARLQRRDLMILGGLNEGVWPQPAPEDPFLSRGMRTRLGLPSLDARLGLAAHDFAQLANAPAIVLTRALKRQGAPTLASRWLWRLETLARGAGAPLKRAEEPLAWARALDAETRTYVAPAPKPKPPVDARLKRISVTQVETLIRDPYAVYARRILRLEVLNPIGAEPSYRERGNAIHKAIERFAGGEDAGALAALLEEELRAQGFPPARLAAERSRLTPSVRALLAWIAEQRAAGGEAFRERPGALALECGVTLSGKADHIEITAAGAAILDFKTGAPPSDKQVQSGLMPQLPLEAAMVARGAFEGVPKTRANELVYWRIGGVDPRPRVLNLDLSAHETGERALAALENLLRQYARAEQPFLSKPRVQFIKPYADYDLLARRKEWADAEGEE